MHTRWLSRVVPCLGALVLLAACDDADDGRLAADDAPTPEQAAEMERVPETSFTLDDIVLPNGETAGAFAGYADAPADGAFDTAPSANGPQAVKNRIIDGFLTVAAQLTDRSAHVYPAAAKVDGAESPAQQGLAYSYGAKDYGVRRRPPGGGACAKRYALHGLDCSGFMFHVFRGGRLPFTEAESWAANMANVAVLNDKLREAGIKRIEAQDLGELAPSEFETGDIIYWKRNGRVYHIGVVGRTASGGLAVFQSNGDPDGDCARNFAPSRGPRQLSLSDPYWFGGKAGDWGIVRLVTDISGAWDLSGRCQDQQVDAYAVVITLRNEEQQSVTGEGDGVDYDGTPMHVVFTGTYDKPTSVLRGRLDYSFPTKPTRTDEMQVSLDRDDTGYVNTTLIANGGCDAQVRLVSREDAGPSPALRLPPPPSRTGARFAQ